MNTLYSLTKLSIGLSWAFTLHDFITSCNGHLENVDSCADFPNVDTFHYIIYKKISHFLIITNVMSSEKFLNIGKQSHS